MASDKVAASGRLANLKGKTGSRKGVPNKATAELKDMILKALDSAGGVEYLAKQAEASPSAFMALVGRVLPLTVKGAGEDGEHKFVVTWQK